jgi:uncharacterized membrane protein
MRISRLKLVLLMVMSAFGLVAAATVLVTYYEMKTAPPFCTAGSVGGIALNCNAVLGSRFSEFFGIPLEFFAAGYFIVNVVLVCLIAFGSERVFAGSLNVLFGWRFLGLIFVPYLVGIELLILRAICIYCTIMHVAIVADFAVITYFLFYRKDFPSPMPEGSINPMGATE